jgi:hypothetical protein
VCSPRVRLDKVAAYAKRYCSSAIRNHNFAASDIRSAAILCNLRHVFTYEVTVATEGCHTGQLPRSMKAAVFWEVTLFKATMKT